MKDKTMPRLSKEHKKYVEDNLAPQCARLFTYYIERYSQGTLDIWDKEKIAHDLKMSRKVLNKTHEMLIIKGWLYLDSYPRMDGKCIYIEMYGEEAVRMYKVDMDSKCYRISHITIGKPNEPIRLPPAI